MKPSPPITTNKICPLPLKKLTALVLLLLMALLLLEPATGQSDACLSQCLVLGAAANLIFCERVLRAINRFLDDYDDLPAGLDRIQVEDVEFDGCEITVELELEGDLTDGNIEFPFDGDVEFQAELQYPKWNLVWNQRICLDDLEVTDIDSDNDAIDDVIKGVVNDVIPEQQCFELPPE